MPRWILKMLADVILFGVANRSYGTSVAILTLLAIALSVVAAQVSSPLIYALF